MSVFALSRCLTLRSLQLGSVLDDFAVYRRNERLPRIRKWYDDGISCAGLQQGGVSKLFSRAVASLLVRVTQ